MGNIVVWRSKKQPMVARSSIAEKYRAMTHETCEGV